jgi:hypothetical protein
MKRRRARFGVKFHFFESQGLRDLLHLDTRPAAFYGKLSKVVVVFQRNGPEFWPLGGKQHSDWLEIILQQSSRRDISIIIESNLE